MRRRGVAVATVLAGGVLLLIFCLLVATFCITQLDFSRNFREHAEGEQLARAAVAMIVGLETRNGQPNDPLGGGDLAQRYHWQNLFGNDSARLGGSVSVGFSPDPARGYYSLDNHLGSQKAAGCLDRGTNRRSVPPYSVQFLMKVQSGGRTSWYDVILQKRWPYVVTTREPVTFTNAQKGPPSLVTGKVLALPRGGKEVANPESPVLLNKAQFQGLAYQRYMQAEGGVSVGGFDNQLIGDVNFLRGVGDLDPCVVAVDRPENIWEGAARTSDGDPKRLLEDVMGQFARPPLSYSYLNVGQPMYKTGPQLFLLDKDLTIMGTQPDGFDPAKFPGECAFGSDFLIDASLGNTYLPDPKRDSDEKRVRMTKCSLNLQDTRLYIRGDLDLTGPRTDVGGNNLPLLNGSNATLVVYGTLRVDGGILDAVDQGMVIYCERLIMKASGEYRGLITVRDCAVFYPEIREVPQASGKLAEIMVGFKLHGGLIVGGKPVLVQYDENPEKYMDGQEMTVNPNEVVKPPVLATSYGVCMSGVTLEYDPAYLKTLHQFGDYELLSVRRVP